LRLSDDQNAALKDLNHASTKAADIMKANCQRDQTVTPTGRVALMEERLSAMLKALDAVQSVLTTFYDSLSDEQKARFNRLGVEG
jgi:ABC-type transporter MlaC component